MVRTSRPLVERMTLIWHDWFATSNDGADSQRLMLEQNALFRRNALGSFRDLLLQVTHDRAMLLWLNGVENEKEAPNENYARDMMELFTLGAGRGYGERDVREQARALTGWGRELRALAARSCRCSSRRCTSPTAAARGWRSASNRCRRLRPVA
jgi:uncharacterized protein (DUF1800 family)